MSAIRVLGIGSPFGDDQLGWEVVKRLQKQDSLCRLVPQGLLMSCCDRPGMRILDMMKGASSVLLIDAIQMDAPIGTLHRFENEEIADRFGALSSHAIGIAEAMQIGRALNELPKQVILHGIAIDLADVQFNMTAPVKQAVVELVVHLEKEIRTYAKPQSLR